MIIAVKSVCKNINVTRGALHGLTHLCHLSMLYLNINCSDCFSYKDDDGKHTGSVKVNLGKASTDFNISKSIPHSAILGPLSFIFHFNDLLYCRKY